MHKRRYRDYDYDMNSYDFGPRPFVVDIDEATRQNPNYRTTLWTGNNSQLTLMSIPPGGEIGLESHPDVDQFLRIEEGCGIVKMGKSKYDLSSSEVYDGYAIFVPRQTWHNLINTGSKPIKLYSIYAPPNHPHGTIQRTKAEADVDENKSNYSCC